MSAWPDSHSSPTMPSFADMLAARLGNKAKTEDVVSSPDGFDPCKLMIKRKQAVLKGEDCYGEELKPPEIQKYPEADVKALEDYCKKMGVVGFSTKQSPKLALMQLKQQLGDFTGIPLEQRILPGYESIGSSSSNKKKMVHEYSPA